MIGLAVGLVLGAMMAWFWYEFQSAPLVVEDNDPLEGTVESRPTLRNEEGAEL